MDSILIKLPRLVLIDSHSEFNTVCDILTSLNNIGETVKWMEIDHSLYTGILYIGNKPTKQQITELLNKDVS